MPLAGRSHERGDPRPALRRTNARRDEEKPSPTSPSRLTAALKPGCAGSFATRCTSAHAVGETNANENASTAASRASGCSFAFRATAITAATGIAEGRSSSTRGAPRVARPDRGGAVSAATSREPAARRGTSSRGRTRASERLTWWSVELACDRARSSGRTRRPSPAATSPARRPLRPRAAAGTIAARAVLVARRRASRRGLIDGDPWSANHASATPAFAFGQEARSRGRGRGYRRCGNFVACFADHAAHRIQFGASIFARISPGEEAGLRERDPFEDRVLALLSQLGEPLRRRPIGRRSIACAYAYQRPSKSRSAQSVGNTLAGFVEDPGPATSAHESSDRGEDERSRLRSTVPSSRRRAPRALRTSRIRPRSPSMNVVTSSRGLPSTRRRVRRTSVAERGSHRDELERILAVGERLVIDRAVRRAAVARGCGRGGRPRRSRIAGSPGATPVDLDAQASFRRGSMRAPRR